MHKPKKLFGVSVERAGCDKHGEYTATVVHVGDDALRSVCPLCKAEAVTERGSDEAETAQAD